MTKVTNTVGLALLLVCLLMAGIHGLIGGLLLIGYGKAHTAVKAREQRSLRTPDLTRLSRGF
jgi:hypothetical protein